MGKLDGKTAIITGGGSGFGEATAKLFAAEGAEVVAACRTEKSGERVAAEIKEQGGIARFYKTDVTDAEQVRRLITFATEEFGKLDILFNNAGILGSRSTYTAEMNNETARNLLDTNIYGVYLCTRYAIPEMLKNGGGSIIMNGSDSAYLGNRGLAVYCGTKAAVMAFGRAVAMEYAREGIRVNTVSPGAGETPMHKEIIEGKPDAWKAGLELIPDGRACMPEDIAKAALFFASDDSKHVTGANLMVDGGWLVKGL